MKEKGHNKKGSLSEFQRYIRGEMTKRQENAFQRKLQRDPFAEEAAEGFSEISSHEAAEDMDKLGKRLKNRASSPRRILFYRIAASIAVLMIIASVFVIVERYRPVKQPGKSTVTPPAPEKAYERPLTEPMVAETVNETIAPEKNKPVALVSAAEQKIRIESSKTAISAGTDVAAFDETTEVLAMAEETDSATYITADQIAIPAAASRKREMADTHVMEKEMQIKPAPSVSELSDVVFTGYSAAKKAEPGQAGYISPQPVTGTTNFERYIEENIRRPQTLARDERAVAVVSFLVRTTGAIDSLRVVESPGEEFADEAMRLIREGPAWKPAEENGQPIDDKVQLRIVFK